MIKKIIPLLLVVFSIISCVKPESAASPNNAAVEQLEENFESASQTELELPDAVPPVEMVEAAPQNVYTVEELRASAHEVLMRDAGKVFYILSDNPVGEFCNKAQVFTDIDGIITVYLTIDDNIIRDRVGTVLMDGSGRGYPFHAWQMESLKPPREGGFYIYMYLEGAILGYPSADPLLFEYNSNTDLLYIWHIDPSLY
jgi:hypothetical protein